MCSSDLFPSHDTQCGTLISETIIPSRFGERVPIELFNESDLLFFQNLETGSILFVVKSNVRIFIQFVEALLFGVFGSRMPALGIGLEFVFGNTFGMRNNCFQLFVFLNTIRFVEATVYFKGFRFLEGFHALKFFRSS